MATKKTKDFKDYLKELDDPKNNQEVNYSLPENPTPLQVAKFKLCKKILGYKLDNNLSREELANSLDLSLAETEGILFCHIEEFTLDRLVSYASKLFEPLELDVVKSKERQSLFTH